MKSLNPKNKELIYSIYKKIQSFNPNKKNLTVQNVEEFIISLMKNNE